MAAFTGNSVLLKGIMREGNAYSINKRNGNMAVHCQAYVELADGTRILGKTVCCSLQDMIEGTKGITGVDQIWNSLTAAQQQAMLQMYKTFEDVMSTWNIPNLKAAAQ